MRNKRPWCFPVRAGWALSLLIISGVFATVVHASSEANAFAAGVSASQSGDYEQAIRHFREAYQQGLTTGALHHNLGVAYYKTGRYELARKSFKRAAQTPGLRALSQYNLGLVEQAAGNKSAARDRFQNAYDGAGTTKLKRLAARQLELKAVASIPYSAYVEAFSGYDSNPRLSEGTDILSPDSQREGDAVIGALVAGRYWLSGDRQDGVAVFGNAYISHFLDLDDEDIFSGTFGGAYYRQAGAWRNNYQLGFNQLRLGGDTLSNSIRLQTNGERNLTRDLALNLRARVEYFDGDNGNGFGFLTGWQADTRLRLEGFVGVWHWRTHYQFEYNDRDDLSVDDDFFSVSPLRHEFSADLERPLVGQLRGQAGLDYRLSEYQDAEVRDAVSAGKRKDDRLSIRIGLFHPLGRAWIGRIEANYRDNNSNFNRFDYERTEVLLSVGRAFN